MKSMFVSLAAMFAIVGLMNFAPLQAAEKAAKEQTLTGTMTCAKCALKEASKCQNALIVTKGDTKTTYLLAANKVSKDFHENVCQGEMANVKVTGTVAEKDGKKEITASKIES